LLLKQLLPDICQAAGDFYFSVHHSLALKSTELLRHKTPDFTSPDVASQHTRPQFCWLQIIESNTGMCSSETASDVKHRWWALVINRMAFY